MPDFEMELNSFGELVMDKTQLLKIFTQEQRIDVDFPGITREVDGQVVRHINVVGEDGFVIYTHLDETSIDDAITAQIARYQSISQDFEWKVYDYDPPKDLIERLRQRGFEIGDPEALLVLELDNATHLIEHSVPSSVVRVSVPEQIDELVDLENAVWKSDHVIFGESLKQELREYPEKLSIYYSYEGEQLAAGAWIYFHERSSFASLWGGATRPDFRKRGHYTNILAARAQEANARGFKLLTVDASPMSRPILEKFGFQFLAITTPCKWKFG